MDIESELPLLWPQALLFERLELPKWPVSLHGYDETSKRNLAFHTNHGGVDGLTVAAVVNELRNVVWDDGEEVPAVFSRNQLREVCTTVFGTPEGDNEVADLIFDAFRAISVPKEIRVAEMAGREDSENLGKQCCPLGGFPTFIHIQTWSTRFSQSGPEAGDRFPMAKQPGNGGGSAVVEASNPEAQCKFLRDSAPLFLRLESWLSTPPSLLGMAGVTDNCSTMGGLNDSGGSVASTRTVGGTHISGKASLRPPSSLSKLSPLDVDKRLPLPVWVWDSLSPFFSTGSTARSAYPSLGVRLTGTPFSSDTPADLEIQAKEDVESLADPSGRMAVVKEVAEYVAEALEISSILHPPTLPVVDPHASAATLASSPGSGKVSAASSGVLSSPSTPQKGGANDAPGSPFSGNGLNGSFGGRELGGISGTSSTSGSNSLLAMATSTAEFSSTGSMGADPSLAASFSKGSLDNMFSSPAKTPLSSSSRFGSITGSSGTLSPCRTGTPGTAEEDAAQIQVKSPFVVQGYHRRTVVRTAEQVGKRFGIIAKCSGCDVYLLSPVKSLVIVGCVKCTIFVGAVEGSISLRSCDRVRVVACTSRIQVSRSSDISLALAVNSPPVFGGLTMRVRVAPHASFYPALGDHLVAAGVSPLLQHNCWSEPVVMRSPLGGGLAPASPRIGGRRRSPTATSGDSLGSSGVGGVVQALPPRMFFPFVVPFTTPGDTTAPPCELPVDYETAVADHAGALQKIRDNIASRLPDPVQQEKVMDRIWEEFQKFVTRAGHTRLLRDIAQVEEMLTKTTL